MNIESIRAEVFDAADDLLEHAENAGETEVWAGINLDDASGIQSMIEEGLEFYPGDWIIAKQILEHRLENLQEILNGGSYTDMEIRYFDTEIAFVTDAIEACG